jgi:hypothetical protein
MERAGNANTEGDNIAREQRVPDVEVEDVQVKKYNIHVSRIPSPFAFLTRRFLNV